MSRSERQSKILSLIATNDVNTQEELVLLLRQEGCKVTQATISRDIKELGLVKTQATNGAHRYATKQTVDVRVSNKLLNVVREAILSVVTANNMVVVKTISDSASAVSSALEQILAPDIVGIVADRNTILIICMTDLQATIVATKVKHLV